MSHIVGNSSSALFSALERSNSVNYAQEQEVHDVLEFLRLEHNKNIQYKILLNILEEYIREDTKDNKVLKEKVRDIILSHRVSQTLVLDTNTSCGEAQLLGIHKMNTISLSYLEGNTLQEVLKSKLKQQKNLCNKLNKTVKSSNTNISNGYNASLQLNSEERVLLSNKEKLLLEQQQYITNLANFEKALLDISELRLKKLPDAVEFKIKISQAQEKINNFKAIFTEEKCRVDIFKETEFSLPAYKELIQDIKYQLSVYQKEIQELEDLKEKYRQVSCKQFDDLLSSYRQYKASLEQKKKLYSYLNN